MELCENGNLLNFLRKNRQKTSEDFCATISSLDPLVRVRIAYDVSKGMHFLEDNKVRHSSLAPLMSYIATVGSMASSKIFMTNINVLIGVTFQTAWS